MCQLGHGVEDKVVHLIQASEPDGRKGDGNRKTRSDSKRIAIEGNGYY